MKKESVNIWIIFTEKNKYQLSNSIYLFISFYCVFSIMFEVPGTNSDKEEKKIVLRKKTINLTIIITKIGH